MLGLEPETAACEAVTLPFCHGAGKSIKDTSINYLIKKCLKDGKSMTPTLFMSVDIAAAVRAQSKDEI